MALNLGAELSSQQTRDLARLETREERLGWARVRRAETGYAISLRGLAKQIGLIVTGMWPEQPEDAIALALMRYAEIIGPWAQAVAGRMLADVSRRDQAQWNRVSRTMSRSLREEIERAPTGEALRKLLDLQVELITSLPLDAATRVHELAIEGLQTGARANELAAKILATGHVTASRANLIARTETARAASTLTQVRAKYVGSTHYIWRTSGDSDVRPLHRKLNGKTIAWDNPPVSGEDGEKAHAGTIYNCRCFASPIISEEF
jgi:SPP1 gp7 family putative phage head morphogenesis protein